MSSLPNYKRVISPDTSVNHLQDAVAPIFDSLQAKELIKGRLIKDVIVTTSTVTINHGLGRQLIGWHIVRKNADANVWEDSAPTTTQLVLDSDATVTVSLWVF